MVLVARFGLPIDIGGNVALLHERAMLGLEEAVQLPDVRPFMASVLVHRLPDGRSEVAWAFAIDTDAYRASPPGD